MLSFLLKFLLFFSTEQKLCNVQQNLDIALVQNAEKEENTMELVDPYILLKLILYSLIH